jgi:t-SNARE complex subunit (syntaxin)
MLYEPQNLTPFYRQSQQRRQRLEKIEKILIDIHQRLNTMTDENRKFIETLEFNAQIDWVQKKLAQF